MTINNIWYQVRNIKPNRGAIKAAGLWLTVDASQLSVLSSHKMQMEVQERYLVTSALAVDCLGVEPIRRGPAAEKCLWRILQRGGKSPHRVLIPPVSN